jgi:hypothetical protein
MVRDKPFPSPWTSLESAGSLDAKLMVKVYAVCLPLIDFEI